MYSKPIKNLIDDFAKLPSIGPRQATRIVFSLLKKQGDFVQKFSSDLLNLKKNIKLCQNCFLSYENENGKTTCHICSNPKREKTTICIIQKEIEVANIERTGLFNGMYHIIGEDINIFESNITSLSIKKLIEKINNLKNQLDESDHKKIEIILATNPTTEGDAVLMYLEQKLLPLNIKLSSLGRGLSSGGELEYTDQNTLSHAFKNRI
jgi:recombination protein RecR